MEFVESFKVFENLNFQNQYFGCDEEDIKDLFIEAEDDGFRIFIICKYVELSGQYINRLNLKKADDSESTIYGKRYIQHYQFREIGKSDPYYEESRDFIPCFIVKVKVNNDNLSAGDLRKRIISLRESVNKKLKKIYHLKVLSVTRDTTKGLKFNFYIGK